METRHRSKVMLNTLYGVRSQEAAIANNCLWYQMAVCLSNARTCVCLKQRLRMEVGPNSRIIYADTDSVKCAAMDD